MSVIQRNFDLLIGLLFLIHQIHGTRFHQPFLPPFLRTQHYLAVPGQIVQHYIEAPVVPVLTAPPPPYKSRYEADNNGNGEMLNGDSNNNGDNPDMSGMPEVEQPPSMMSPPPPAETENEKPPTKVVHKHVSIHVPPEEMEEDDQQVKIIRPQSPGPAKHVNIIFIKAPSPQTQKGKTEVILPEVPEHKTLVYVLVKRQEPAKEDSVRVRGPPPTQPPKPQVYFIRYKENRHDSMDGLSIYSGKGRYSSYQRRNFV